MHILTHANAHILLYTKNILLVQQLFYPFLPFHKVELALA